MGYSRRFDRITATSGLMGNGDVGLDQVPVRGRPRSCFEAYCDILMPDSRMIDPQ